MKPLDRLKYHVTGAIERGEKQAIESISTTKQDLTKQEIKSILVALNSPIGLGFKYPIGNKELTIQVRQLESNGIIHYNPMTQLWSKRGNNVFFKSDDKT